MSFLAPIAPIIGAVGGLLGGKKSSGGTQTAERTPWGPAQPWIQANIDAGQKLQDYYQQNPFNAQQRTGYDNLYANLDNFNGQIAPAMNQLANNMMARQYQRPTYARPGMAGYGQPSTQPTQNLGFGQNASGPFSVAPVGKAYGQVDWEAAKGPYSKSFQPPAQAETPVTDQAAFAKAMQEYQKKQYEDWINSASSNWNAGFGA